MTIQITTLSSNQTEAVAADLARVLPPGCVVLLSGDLGAGKTVFARAMIRTLTGDFEREVASPTFNLVYVYDTARGPVSHFDLYRVKDEGEIEEIGFDDARTGAATIVEWPDRLGARLKTLHRVVAVHLSLSEHHPNHRRIEIDMSSIVNVPRMAFVFAAGLGNRMKPLTDQMPKPLVPVNGRPVLAYMFDQLRDAGVQRIVMNTHHLPGMMTAFADGYRDCFDIRISHEPDLLETGGGMKAALPLFNDDIFYAVNGDSPLIDGPGLPALARLAATFDPETMDILLLLQPNRGMITPFVGDYTMADDGRLTRSLTQTGTHMFAGVRILHRRVMETAPTGRYTFRDQMDEAQRQGRLFGLEHHGEWHHLSTPVDVETVTRHVSGRDVKQVQAM